MLLETQAEIELYSCTLAEAIINGQKPTGRRRGSVWENRKSKMQLIIRAALVKLNASANRLKRRKISQSLYLMAVAAGREKA